ncbi:MAG: hypothetical protein DRI90_13945, partial [Deltaproteobacteria bacterium]
GTDGGGNGPGGDGADQGSGSGGIGPALGIVLTATGAAALAVGVVLGVVAISEIGDAESDPDLCPNKLCTPEGREVIDGVEPKGTAATLTIGLGSAAVVAGVLLLLLTDAPEAGESDLAHGKTKRRADAAPAARLVPRIDTSGGGLVLIGTF